MLRPAVAAVYRARALEKALDRAGDSNGLDIVRWRLSVKERGFRHAGPDRGCKVPKRAKAVNDRPETELSARTESGLSARAETGLSPGGEKAPIRLWTKGLGIDLAI